MKFASIIVALAAVGANAFVAPGPQGQNSALMSSRDYIGSVSTAPGQRAPAQRGDANIEPRSISGESDIWERLNPVTVQGSTLRTWSFSSPSIERVQVLLGTQGRPLNANVDLWQGPDNTPQKMAVYVEDGLQRPFRAVISTPRGSNSVAVRNTGPHEFPLAACVEADNGSANLGLVINELATRPSRTIQGGAVHTYPFAPAVSSVQVMLRTDGRPLNARLELLQGPNNSKQVIELYTEDGMERPFFAVIETPGVGNVVRIVNTATIEYPLTASVEPFVVEQNFDESVAMTGDSNIFGDRPRW